MWEIWNHTRVCVRIWAAKRTTSFQNLQPSDWIGLDRFGSNETLFDHAHTKWQTDKSLVIFLFLFCRANSKKIAIVRKRTWLPNKHFALCRSNIWKCWLTQPWCAYAKNSRGSNTKAHRKTHCEKPRGTVAIQQRQLLDIQTDMFVHTPDLIYILMRCEYTKWKRFKMKEEKKPSASQPKAYFLTQSSNFLNAIYKLNLMQWKLNWEDNDCTDQPNGLPINNISLYVCAA